MAVESKRGCGYRKVGGIYFVGEFKGIPCDRLPYPLHECPVCGSGIKVGRGLTKINPLELFGLHTGERMHLRKWAECKDVIRPCTMCDPTEETAYIMGVGERYYPTPADFIEEGTTQGFSKRISQIPKDFELNKTIIYLSHPKACSVKEPVPLQQIMSIAEANMGTVETNQPALIDAEKVTHTKGIFAVFIPQKIEKLYWQRELDAMTDKEKLQITKRGITLVGIPDGDKDH